MELILTGTSEEAALLGHQGLCTLSFLYSESLYKSYKEHIHHNTSISVLTKDKTT